MTPPDLAPPPPFSLKWIEFDLYEKRISINTAVAHSAYEYTRK